MKRTPTIWSEHLINGIIYPEYPETSIYDFLVERTASSKDLIAIEFEGKKTRYGELLDQIDAASRSMLAMGLKKGDIITIISPNIPQAVVTFYAANRVGACANILHPLLPAAELQHHIENTDSKVVFIPDLLYQKLEHLVWKDEPPRIVLYSIPDALNFPKKLFVKRMKPAGNPANVFSWRAFLKNRVSDPVYPKVVPNDMAVILYSGGTTGAQKGVCLSNWNITNYAVQCHEVGECIPHTRTLAVMPIFHGFGLCSAINNMLTCSSHLYLLPTYDAVKCNKLIFKNKIETIFAVPAIYDALVHSNEMNTKDYNFLKYMFCGGDKLRPETEHRMNALMEKIGSPAKILPGYGLTECVAGCLSNAIFVTKEGTSGMAFPDTQIKIVEPGTETELPTGAEGELCVCGPTVMMGYYKDEEATRKVLKVHADGKTWLHTGDVFSVDEDGFYTFHSRLSRMLVVNGYNVYPEMVENAFLQIPGVSKCCVVGKPARVGGDLVVAAVCLSKDGLTPDDITKKCGELLPAYAIPHQIVVMDQLPSTRVGKVDYKKVAEMIREC